MLPWTAPTRASTQSGPLWAMDFAEDGEAPVGFVASSSALEYELEAGSNGRRASQRVTRRWAAKGVGRQSISGDGFSGQLYLPESGTSGPGVLMIPGSTGVAAVEPEAALLASHGYCAFAAAYMQERGLPASLREVPVEALLAASRALADHERVDAERMAGSPPRLAPKERSLRSP